MWPKPEFAGSTFLTKASDSTPEPNTSKLVGYTVSPESKFIMHFPSFPPKATIRFTGMDRYKFLQCDIIIVLKVITIHIKIRYCSVL